MLPKRLSGKFNVVDPASVNLEAFVPVFHRWIQDDALEGLLIDVADYAHVHHGPGVLLIGHEGDYSLDMSGGQPGLLYTRKQKLPETLDERLTLVVRLALSTAILAASEDQLGNLEFDYRHVQLTFIDRLNTSNTQATFEALQPQLQSFASRLYGDAEVTLAANDPRDNLTVHIATANRQNPDELLEKLNILQPVTS